MPLPPEKILKIHAKILQFRDTFPHKIMPVNIILTAIACVNGKVLVGSNNPYYDAYSHKQWQF